jgi:hypothetical protein
MSTLFAQLMREFREKDRFEILENGYLMKYKEIAAVMITHIYLHEFSE